MVSEGTSHTLAELVERANQEYPGLTEGSLRVLIHRGQFPPSHLGSGTRSDPHRWTEEELRLLLDRRYVQRQKNRSEAIELGLWLHGWDVGPAGKLLATQIEDMQRLLVSRAIVDGSHFTDTEIEAINEAISHGIAECGVLSDLVRGDYPTLIADRFEEYEEMVHAEVTADVLRRFPYPRSDSANPGHVIYPAPEIPARVRRTMEEDAVRVRLEVILDLVAPWQDGPFWSLPRLASLLRDAPADALKSARWAAHVELFDLIKESDSRRGEVPDFAALDVSGLQQLCRGDIRHLFGHPALFPYMAMEIGTSLHDRSSPHHVTKNLYMLPLAIKRLFEEPQRRAKKRDALLTLLFSFDPKYHPNPRAAEAWRQMMRRKDRGSTTSPEDVAAHTRDVDRLDGEEASA